MGRGRSFLSCAFLHSAVVPPAQARLRWNRRKASACLNVSDKKLLSTIKECGIKLSEAS